MAGDDAQDGDGASSWGLGVPVEVLEAKSQLPPTQPSGLPPVDFLGLTAPLLLAPPIRTATGSLEEVP